MASPTLKDVARLAGVSLATASRALNHPDRVTPALVQRVRRAAAGLNYHPNITARNLRTARTLTLGLLFHRLESPVALEALQTIDQASREHGYSLLVTNAQGDASVARGLVRRVLERRVDGLFIYRPTGMADAVESARAAGIPVLALFSRGRESGDVPLVTHEPAPSSSLALRRLATLGHQSVAYFATTLEMHDLRTQELRSTSERLGLRFRMLPVPDSPDELALRASVQSMLELEHPPTAIFARHRHIPGLLPPLREAGVRIPQDLSLISYGDSEWLRAFDPAIATVSTDGRDLGFVAVSTMMRALQGESLPDVIHARPSVWIERPSVGPHRA